MQFFQPNNTGIRALLVGPEIAEILTQIGEKGKSYAESISPVVTGDYASKFEVHTELITLAFTTGRSSAHQVVAGILANTSDHAAAVEWGNSADNKPHHVLSKTRDFLVANA